MAIYLYVHSYESFLLETELHDHTCKSDDTLFHSFQNWTDKL